MALAIRSHAHANPAGQGQIITLTAIVSGAFGGTPGGTVTFEEGLPLGTASLNGSGAATFTISTLSIGTRGIRVVTATDAASSIKTTQPTVVVMP